MIKQESEFVLLFHCLISDRDEMYKRKQNNRFRINSVEKALQLVVSDKTNGFRCNFQPLKVFLILIALACFIAIILYPPLCRQKTTSRKASRWILDGSGSRYTSDSTINWEEISNTLDKLPEKNKIHRVGLLNFDENEIQRFRELVPTAKHMVLHLKYTGKNTTWESLYPEWIDEEQEELVPTCPSLPKVCVPKQHLDLIAVKLPCRNEANWSRDVARLHLQKAAAALATASKGNLPVHLLFVTRCLPIPNLFTCKDLVAREGSAWLYEPRLDALREKIQLPIGSCELAIHQGTNIKHMVAEQESGHSTKRQREAYATILHSADVYVCGAIAAAQSIGMAGSIRDLVILVDETISEYHCSGLELAGWKVRTIKRIRNPKAEKDAYNEWNYSKFRLWQLTDYDKIIFIDADLLILRNIDFLFQMPEISATGNNGTLFNSGVMVIEPSNCTFQLLMDHINQTESYNGGDQGYLNEIFTWWHRIPKHMNFLKNFWHGDDESVKQKKTRLFEAEPPVVSVLHYLGNKPWMCFRDYDCNWNVDILHEFASDAAHRKWWKVHDAMPEKLREFCLLPSKHKAQLEWDRRQAEKGNYSDGHWKIRIKDKRIKRCIDPPYCHWRSMLRHWGEKNWTGGKFPPPALGTNSGRF